VLIYDWIVLIDIWSRKGGMKSNSIEPDGRFVFESDLENQKMQPRVVPEQKMDLQRNSTGTNVQTANASLGLNGRHCN
jgi:hypothetical protein